MIVATPGGRDALVAVAQPRSTSTWSSLASDTFTGRNVTPESALGVTAYYGGVRLVAGTIGASPLRTWDEKGPRPVEVRGGQLATMLREQPNADVNAVVFWTAVASHLEMRGNAYIAKLRDKRGFVTELWLIGADRVTPFRDQNRRKFFHVIMGAGEGRIEYFDSRSILHVVGHSFGDGLVGHSPVAVQRQRLGVALAASEYQARWYKQGTIPSGILKVAGALSKDRRDEIKAEWASNYSGSEAAHRVPVLEQGSEYTPISLSHVDQQFIEQQRMSATEVATMLTLPAAMLNADSGGSLRYENPIHNDLTFQKYSITPRVRFIEAALNADEDLFGAGSGWSPRFDTQHVTMADAMTQAQIDRLDRANGKRNANELREPSGLAPRTDEYGEMYVEQLVAAGVNTSSGGAYGGKDT